MLPADPDVAVRIHRTHGRGEPLPGCTAAGLSWVTWPPSSRGPPGWPTAAVALRARDQQGPPVCFQLLNQPELDDRQAAWRARHFTDTPWMTRDKLAATWRHYLGSVPASPYAAPARAGDLSGLPSPASPTFELVGLGLDPGGASFATGFLRSLPPSQSAERSSPASAQRSARSAGYPGRPAAS